MGRKEEGCSFSSRGKDENCLKKGGGALLAIKICTVRRGIANFLPTNGGEGGLLGGGGGKNNQ